MDSKKNDNRRKPEHDQEYGEPGFVFTDYDRGAKAEDSESDSKDERRQSEDN